MDLNATFPLPEGFGGMTKWLCRIVAAVVVTACSAIAHAETLKVGSTPTGVPFTFLNTATGKVDGMMIDLIEAMGKDDGFDVEIVPMAFGSLVPALTSGKIDIISAAMSATPVRQKVVDFTGPIMTYGEGLVVAAVDKKDYHTIADLKGNRVGAVIGTNYLDQLRATGLFSDVAAYDSLADIIRDVGAGRLQAGLGDFPILAYNFSHTSMPAVRLVEGYQPMTVGPVNIAVRKDEGPLLVKLEAKLARFRQNGTLDKILGKWNLK